MTDRGLAQHPAWLRDIDSALTVSTSFVLHGNIRDRYPIPTEPGGWQPMSLHDALWDTLRRSDFAVVIRHTPLGVVLTPDTDEARALVTRVTGLPPDRLAAATGPEQLTQILRAVTGCREARIALAVDYVSQWRPAGQPPTEGEHALMLAAFAASHDPRSVVVGTARRSGLHNPVVWVVDQPADLPAWIAAGSDGTRQISVPRPDLDARLQIAEKLMPVLSAAPGTDASVPTQVVRDGVEVLAERTEGMTLQAMTAIVRLARDQGLAADRIEDAVRAYRVGLTENPWARPSLQQRIREADKTLGRQVLGQERAVRHALDILIRSTTGMTGAELGHDTSGPRGILFFAGPTGVGKTELAKRITHLVFGDTSAYVRFDMSEFAEEHHEARLIGSPPGYQGHGEGGELTNAVRQRPFSLVLFDEIEKAHPRILDKFLQILSDGRLTDGSGDTVYFSESVIVFTSNLGVAPLAPDAPVPRGEDLERQVKAGIEGEFARLNRPELLGRIGEDNIVVFDYIDPVTARELAGIFIDNVLNRASDRVGCPVSMAEEVRTYVVDLSVRDLSKGGRGISRAMESVLVNPLARAVFELPPASRTSLTVRHLAREVGGWHTAVLA